MAKCKKDMVEEKKGYGRRKQDVKGKGKDRWESVR